MCFTDVMIFQSAKGLENLKNSMDIEEQKEYIKWCEQCECWMFICPKCSNNCCNGGFGDSFVLKLSC